MRILTEATGSLTTAYLINSIKEAGHKAIGSDISKENHGISLCDDFILMPSTKEPDLWDKTTNLLAEYNIDVVIPSLDETLIDWAKRKDHFKKKGVHVILSPEDTIQVFQDKWETFKFFQSIDLDCPRTSLDSDYPLIKPRLGRGSTGIYVHNFDSDIDMKGCISQELIKGKEYTVDCFFDQNGEPLYIIPRERLGVKEGKSTKGHTIRNERIKEEISYVAKKIKCYGPINFQLFITAEGDHKYIEVNPRIAGGMALGFAASENWISLIVDGLINGRQLKAKPVNYDLKMYRYYNEVFV